ncbi:MAG: outer membrane protein assembly factor BamA [Candidatus Thioglobus sp.]|jgi:outer membrane protein insertion porin family|nr:outer membrane protein assembly factor BamA [Candidatus Thioglobus sp.]
MKIRIIQIIFFISISLSFQGFAETISKIEFSGLNLTPKSTVMSKLPVKIGDEYSSNTSNKIISSLFDTGYFSDIQVELNNDILLIAVIENPRIKLINIKSDYKKSWSNWFDNSNQKLALDKASIDELVSNYELSAGDIYSKKKLHELVSEIKNQYLAIGYFNIEIAENLQIDSQNRIDIELNISQGKEARIGLMSISGNSIFEDEELSDQFSFGIKTNSFINYFTNKDRYTELAFDEGMESISSLYMNSGYLNFKFTSVNKTLSEDKEHINIEIEIDEGIQYKLGTVNFEGEFGNQKHDDLMRLVSIQKGEIFNWEAIVNDVQKITDVFVDQGYAFANINPTTEDVLGSVNIYFNISLNKKVYVNRIKISGNTRTQDEVIRREILLSEGSLFSRSALNESVINLRRLGYFSDVEMEASKVEGMPDKIDLNFAVKETKTGAISFSVSHSNNYGISFGAGIQEKNIFGSGNTFNVNLKMSESFKKLSIYFEDPYFNVDNHSISYGAFYSEQSDDDVMSDSYTVNSKGLSLGYGVPLTKYTRLNTKLEYANNDLVCSSGFAASSYEPTQCANNSNDEVVFGLSWNESTLNHYLYPTDGKSNALSVDVALPLSDYRYVSVNANHVSYKPLSGNLTLKLTGSLGLISGYSGNEVPFFKRYFGGGSGSVRGFGNRTLGPTYPNSAAKGGEISVLGSFNIISPASFISNSENMRVSAFVDTGNIFEKSSSMKLGDLRMSTGVAFAYLSPIGAIGAYWSTPILKKTGDDIENFSFSLGTGF